MKKCYFCQFQTEPNYQQVEILEKFLTARKKIVSGENSGVCAKHQRHLAKNIKYARYLALLPYTSYQSDKIR